MYNINTARRSVSTRNEVAPGVFVRLSTTHDRSRKRYVTTLARETHDGDFITFRLLEDTHAVSTESTGRYSLKGLKAVHAEQEWRVEDPATVKWGREIVQA